MISKAAIKRIRALATKKGRAAEGLFVAEGAKVVEELSRRGAPVAVYYGDDAARATLLQHPQGTLALFRTTLCDAIQPLSSLALMLDDVQDPGNLGTIIRVADWFGIDHIYCSQGCADVFNPKVVQATMGAIAHVKVEYGDLAAVVAALPAGYPVYATALTGSNIYTTPLTKEGIIILGNEGKGIRASLLACATTTLLIPPYAAVPPRSTVESLNVAIAAAIVCSEFRRL